MNILAIFSDIYKHVCVLVRTCGLKAINKVSRVCFNIKMLSYQYMESHVKDKTYLYHGNPHTWERRSFYWDRAQNLSLFTHQVTSTCTVQYVNMTTDHTYVAQPSTVIMQPVDVASNQQVVHSTQQWTSVGQGSLSPPPPAPQPQCTSPGATSTTPTGSITTVHVSVHPTPWTNEAR